MQTTWLILLITIGFTLCDEIEETALSTTPELIRKYGYSFEEHKVVTSDGYILTHHRIPYGRLGSNNIPRKVVLLLHGILCSSSDWVLKGPEKSLGFILADKGFDVWLLNSRGNKYSSSHLNLVKSQSEFWNFSFHELGTYDLPETIDYVLDLTKQDKVYHVGHSQGTTAFFVMAAVLPQYNAKIAAHFSFSPIVFRTRTQNTLYRFSQLMDAINGWDAIYRLMGHFGWGTESSFLKWLGITFCRDTSIMQPFCRGLYFWLMGYAPKQLNATMLPEFFGHFPVGASEKMLWHSGQLMNSGEFRYFDYKSENEKFYSNTYPPSYDISQISAPIVIFYGGRDRLADVNDVKRFIDIVPNLLKVVYIEEWAHMDFLFGIDAPSEIYEIVIELMRSNDNNVK